MISKWNDILVVMMDVILIYLNGWNLYIFLIISIFRFVEIVIFKNFTEIYQSWFEDVILDSHDFRVSDRVVVAYSC